MNNDESSTVKEYYIEEYEDIDLKQYIHQKHRLRVELLKLQTDIIKNKKSLCVLVEGRDTAGKTSTLNFMIKNLIPDHFRYEKLSIPTQWENTHWLTRWERKLPKKGEIVFFDRSWYSRALIQPVMNYCSQQQYKYFMKSVTKFEEKILDNHTQIIKLYFSISRENQKTRLVKRKESDLKYWRFSDTDAEIYEKWDLFSEYKEKLFQHESNNLSPWVIINSNNKLIAKLTAIRYILSQSDYRDKERISSSLIDSDQTYSIEIEGVLFPRLNLRQYQALLNLTGQKK